MVLVFHHVIIFFLLSDWLIQILPPFWFCCDVACFCFGSETQLKCTYRRCCQFFKNIVLCLDVLSGRESASMATFFFMTLLLFSRMLVVVVVVTKDSILCPDQRSHSLGQWVFERRGIPPGSTWSCKRIARTTGLWNSPEIEHPLTVNL